MSDASSVTTSVNGYDGKFVTFKLNVCGLIDWLVFIANFSNITALSWLVNTCGQLELHRYKQSSLNWTILLMKIYFDISLKKIKLQKWHSIGENLYENYWSITVYNTYFKWFSKCPTITKFISFPFTTKYNMTIICSAKRSGIWVTFWSKPGLGWFFFHTLDTGTSNMYLKRES